MKNKKVKAVMNLHLSVYNSGRHVTTGWASEEDKYYNRLSVSESLVPFTDILQKFGDLQLGTKLKVTVETVK